jgi:sulfur carrier protein
MAAFGKIEVNGEALEIASGCTLTALLGQLDMQNRRIAIALNRSIVPRSRYEAVMLTSGDRVEILEAVGGG